MADAATGDAETGELDSGAHTDAGQCAALTPETGQCRSENDCPSASDQCRFPGDALCGACMPATRECEPGGNDCGLGGTCIEYTPDCTCGGPSSACMADCRTLPSCGQNKRCDQDTGLCTADCLSGAVTCSGDATCKPGDPAAGADGCVLKPCESDADCRCGNLCARGHCYESFGVCGPPPP